jgi:Family of unknown function (DUF5318)
MRKRDVVDYALQRRALLTQLLRGGTSSLDVCDASPYLGRAAKAYGLQTDRTCPICRRERLWEVPWVYGDALGDAAGSARSLSQVRALAGRIPDFAVYEVEVCQDCGWNHLVRSWRTGTPGMPAARRSRRESGT